MGEIIIKKGDIVDNVKIVDIGSKGDAIGKKEGFTIFVDKGVPGDRLKVKITKKKKNYAKSKLLELIEKSDMRQIPKCEYFYDCGGCQIQNIKYSEQLKLKKEKVESTIKRIGKIDNVKVNEVIAMNNPYNYRNKGQFKIEKIGDLINIGFYKRGTHEVIDIDKCLIQSKSINAILSELRDIIKEKNISVYDKKSKKGILREILIRGSEKTEELMIVLVTNGEKLPYKKNFINRLSKINSIKSIIQNINENRKNKILGDKNKIIYGNNKISDIIGSMKFDISPLSFFQVNERQVIKLYNKVLEYAGLNGDEIVFDLYCGTGTIGMFLAKSAKKIYGVEIVDSAVKDAKKNAAINDVENIEFILGKAENEIPILYKKGVRADVVVVDPPRQGCDKKLLETIIDINPKKIIYVSCKPSTLARDLKYLTENRYKVDQVQPVDMFPHSTHIESCVKLIKK